MDTTTLENPSNGDTAVQFMAKVKRATRRRFSAEEKIRIVLDGMKREVATQELCRREGIHPAIFYSWQKDFMEAGKAQLRGDSKRNANEAEVASIRRENTRLKLALGEQVLEIGMLKKTLVGTNEVISK